MEDIVRVRDASQIEVASTLCWEFFDFARSRYPDMLTEIDDYIEQHDIAGQLARFDTLFLPPSGECFLAQKDNSPVGIVMLRPRDDGNGELNRMYVRASARGLGLGRKLAEAVVQEARILGYKQLFLDAFYRHVEALPLYESLGFEYFKDPGAFGGDDARIVHMRMTL